MKAVHSISKAIIEQAITDKLDELDDLLGKSYEELTGIRDAFIQYQKAIEEILKELESETKPEYKMPFGKDAANMLDNLRIKRKDKEIDV